MILPLTRNDTLFYEGAVALLLAATLTVAWIASSRFGMGLIAIREDEDAAAVMGVNTTLYKIAALVLSALFTALAGGIHAYWITFIDPGERVRSHAQRAHGDHGGVRRARHGASGR